LLAPPVRAAKTLLPSAAPAVPAAGAGAAPAPPSPSPSDAGSELDAWKDPEFRKSFMGSYGVLAEREPKLSPQEREALEKIVPLLGSDLPAAETALAALVKPDGSAL